MSSADSFEHKEAALDSAVAFWDARLRSPACTEQDRAEFARWRDADPAHAAAFAKLQLYLETVREHHAAPALRAYRDEALHALSAGRRRRMAMGAGIAAVLLLSVLALSIFQLKRHQPSMQAVLSPSTYQTAVGERSTIMLSDGSHATLDTRSRMEVRFGARQRELRIVEGQVLFEVTKDALRPFVVIAGEQRVTAVGTQFAVRMDADRVSVTLLEGRVRVNKGEASAIQHELSAGQQLVALNNSDKVEIHAANTAATSWRDGKVLFEDKPLAEVVAEINRYSAMPITIRDQSIGQLHVSGMFKTDRPLDFVKALPDYFPVRLDTTAQALSLSSRE